MGGPVEADLCGAAGGGREGGSCADSDRESGGAIGGGLVATRTEVFDTGVVKGSEFLRKLKAMARRRGLAYRWNRERGAGSHGTVYLGDRFSVVKDLKKEIGPGLLADMCKQLEIQKEDL